MRKIYTITSILILLLTIVLLTSCSLLNDESFNGEEVIYNVRTNYVYNVADDNNIEILVYSNNPKSIIKEYEDVQATLTNYDTILSATIINTLQISTHYFNDEKFYAYKMYVKPVDVNFTFDLKECILQTRDLTFEIGSLTVVELNDNSSDLDFTKIYAIGNESLGYKSINAFVVTIKNKKNYTKYLNDFYIGNYNYASLGNAVILDDDINNSTKVTDYIPLYSPFKYTKDNSIIEIGANESIKLLIPVYYDNKAFLGNTLIYINNELYIDNFNYIQNYDDLDSYEGILLEAEFN